MHTLKVEGIVLKRRNVGESDKLLTILTKANGKMQVKAPGVRKIASRRSAHIELLNRVILSLYSRAVTPLVTEAQMVSDYTLIKQDLKKVGYAYHICEITDGLCAENEESSGVFRLLTDTLDSLATTTEPQRIVKEYEFELLNHLGFATSQMQQQEYFNVHTYIESLLEKKLKSKDIFL